MHHCAWLNQREKQAYKSFDLLNHSIYTHTITTIDCGFDYTCYKCCTACLNTHMGSISCHIILIVPGQTYTDVTAGWGHIYTWFKNLWCFQACSNLVSYKVDRNFHMKTWMVRSLKNYSCKAINLYLSVNV